MRKGPLPTMLHFKTYVHMDKFHRKIKYGSVLSERTNSASVSSYIHLSPINSFDSPIHFGRIQFIFKHRFNGVHTLVKVCWFDGFVKDVESGLVFIDLKSNNAMLSTIVSLDEVSRPLIHAIDDNDHNTLDFEFCTLILFDLFMAALIIATFVYCPSQFVTGFEKTLRMGSACDSRNVRFQ